jgi:hypothetical protein
VRLEFEYTLEEWIEWKRSRLSRLSYALFIVGESLLIPARVLSVLSVCLALLIYADLLPRPFSEGMDWVFLTPLILLGLIEIYLSTLNGVRKHVLKLEWEETISHLKYQIDVLNEGIRFNPDGPTSTIPWDQYTSMYQTNRLFILCQDADLLLIPKRVLIPEDKLKAFLDLTHQKIGLDRWPQRQPH